MNIIKTSFNVELAFLAQNLGYLLLVFFVILVARCGWLVRNSYLENEAAKSLEKEF